MISSADLMRVKNNWDKILELVDAYKALDAEILTKSNEQENLSKENLANRLPSVVTDLDEYIEATQIREARNFQIQNLINIRTNLFTERNRLAGELANYLPTELYFMVDDTTQIILKFEAHNGNFRLYFSSVESQ